MHNPASEPIAASSVRHCGSDNLVILVYILFVYQLLQIYSSNKPSSQGNVYLVNMYNMEEKGRSVIPGSLF